MVTKNTNPFVLPGFGQSGDMASNPLLASMEMMRKAWEGMAQASGFDASLLGSAASPEDFDRRIADLRAVENWLRMNLSLLGNTIQTLEVQRSTLATLQAFAATAGGAHSPQTPSPLDQALGIQRGQHAAPGADTSGLFGEGAKARSGASGSQQGQATGGHAAGEGASGGTEQAGAAGSPGGMGAGQAGAEAQGAADATIKSWWDMLQAQFDNLASATAATLQGAGAMQEAATEAQKKAADTAAAAVQAFQETASDVMAPASGAAAKATKKAATKKAASRSGGSAASSGASASTAKKATASKTAAKKTSAKKSTAKKASAKKAAAGKSSKTSNKRATKTANK